MNNSPMLEICGLHAAYDGLEILHGIDLSLQAGEMAALLGPNGSGKSTLLRVISGLLAPRAGEVRLAGRWLHEYGARRRAQLLGLVPQYTIVPFAFSVYDIVAMGRTPHLGLLQSPTEADRIAIEAAMRRTDCLHLQDRLITEISGGEVQRVIIARALAQEPQVLLLDEPTAHLDINHQLEIARMLRGLHGEEGLTVLWVSHDINLAVEFCDRLLVLRDGLLVGDGTAEEIVTEQRLRDIYGMPLQVAPNPFSGRPQVFVSGKGPSA